MINRKRWAVVFLACLGFLGVFPLALPGCSLKEKKQMNSETGISQTLGIPPIDLSIPAQTKTATFALG